LPSVGRGLVPRRVVDVAVGGSGNPAWPRFAVVCLLPPPSGAPATGRAAVPGASAPGYRRTAPPGPEGQRHLSPAVPKCRCRLWGEGLHPAAPFVVAVCRAGACTPPRRRRCRWWVRQSCLTAVRPCPFSAAPWRGVILSVGPLFQGFPPLAIGGRPLWGLKAHVQTGASDDGRASRC